VHEPTADDLETWQQSLKEVGCFGGTIDGELGPRTEAAALASGRPPRGCDGALSLTADASRGKVSLRVDGGDEVDGITLDGRITQADVGANRSFSATGTFSGSNFAGEALTLTGTCPE
jgi:hypothetical protein